MLRHSFRAQGWNPPLWVFGKMLRRIRPARINRKESRNSNNYFFMKYVWQGCPEEAYEKVKLQREVTQE